MLASGESLYGGRMDRERKVSEAGNRGMLRPKFPASRLAQSRWQKNAVDDRDESAAPTGGGGFADHALVSLHCLRVYLEKSYRVALDLLSEMPQILREIGRFEADLPHHSTLVRAFDRFTVAIWQVQLRL